MNPDPLTAELLANGPFARDDAPFQLIEVAGPQAGEFLQRLCTQDVLGLAEGVVAPAAFLDSKGKLLVTCLVFRLGQSFWLETHTEQLERLVGLLERYHFTEKLTIVRRATTHCREVIGASGEQPARRVYEQQEGWLGLIFERRGISFRRLHRLLAVGQQRGAEPGAVDSGGSDLSIELAECLRMAAGLVRIGIETEPTTLALEADLDDHCSTTKGCYTGQEIVARIHTYGHVNRKLCLLQLDAGPAIDAPVPLHDDDDLPVGRVMHAVPVPGKNLRLGLGFLPKDFQAAGTVLKVVAGGSATVLR